MPGDDLADSRGISADRGNNCRGSNGGSVDSNRGNIGGSGGGSNIELTKLLHAIPKSDLSTYVL